MALTNIELYEALKKDLNEDAARMIAEVVPAAQDLATKADVAAVELRLQARFDQLESRMLRWTLTFFVPLWAGVFGVLIAIVTKL